jgi:hypothetical protein
MKFRILMMDGLVTCFITCFRQLLSQSGSEVVKFMKELHNTESTVSWVVIPEIIV